MLDINFAQIFISFIVLLFSLTVHEMAHAWTADRLGDPTARLLGRVSLNPIVHADPIGTILFPLIAMVTGAPLIGWAKPVPVNVRRLSQPRRDYMLVAAAGPASNLALAIAAAIAAAAAAGDAGHARRAERVGTDRGAAERRDAAQRAAGRLQHDSDSAARRRQRARRTAAAVASPTSSIAVRPYGFMLLYALMLTGGLEYLIVPPYRL